jgi:hypothetical protein
LIPSVEMPECPNTLNEGRGIKCPNLAEFPEEVLVEVFTKCAIYGSGVVAVRAFYALVCRSFAAAAESEALWYRLCCEHFPEQYSSGAWLGSIRSHRWAYWMLRRWVPLLGLWVIAEVRQRVRFSSLSLPLSRRAAASP